MERKLSETALQVIRYVEFRLATTVLAMRAQSNLSDLPAEEQNVIHNFFFPAEPGLLINDISWHQWLDAHLKAYPQDKEPLEKLASLRTSYPWACGADKWQSIACPWKQ